MCARLYMSIFVLKNFKGKRKNCYARLMLSEHIRYMFFPTAALITPSFTNDYIFSVCHYFFHTKRWFFIHLRHTYRSCSSRWLIKTMSELPTHPQFFLPRRTIFNSSRWILWHLHPYCQTHAYVNLLICSETSDNLLVSFLPLKRLSGCLLPQSTAA